MDVEELVLKYVEAINSENWGALRGLLAFDVTIRPAQWRPRVGLEDALGFWPKVYRGLSRHHDTVRELRVGRDFAIADLWFEGETLAGSGLEFSAMDVFEVSGGRIERLTIWLDPSSTQA